MVVVTGGGTGGHIFPLISIIEELRRRDVRDIVWIGKRMGEEEKWSEEFGITFFGIRAGKLRRYLSLKNLFDVINILAGFFQSYLLLKRLRPRVLFSKGGFVSVPPALAAHLLRIPVLTHESDLSPGLATRIISRFAEVIFTSFEETGKYLNAEDVVFSGNPIRGLIKEAEANRGKEFLGFENDLPIVTFLGGSLGAEKLNRTVSKMVETLDIKFNIVHQCGSRKLGEKISSIKGKVKNYRVFQFLKEHMGDVLAASDLIVSRAGAGAIYEIAYLEKPSILIPLSRSASRGEQVLNARYFSEKRAAIYIDEEQLTPEYLYSKIIEILDDREKLEEIGRNARKIIKPEAEVLIVDYIVKYLNGVCVYQPREI